MEEEKRGRGKVKVQGQLGDEESGVVAQEVFNKVGLDQITSKALTRDGICNLWVSG